MNDIPSRLKPLVLELQELPDWPATELPAGLLIYDVLVALGTPKEEIEKLLGHEVPTLVEGVTLQDAERTPSLQVC
jgi:(p)ppGpp synthase/HD superfamily hydrolase